MINGLLEEETEVLIFSKKPKLSFVVLSLSIDMEPIFFKYIPKIGILNNSFFNINIGELKTVCKKNVSKID